MGYYINPRGETKEAWLARYGYPIPGPNFNIASSDAFVCLVDNGAFTAAAIGFSAREVEAFNLPTDQRPKQWFSVNKKKLITVCPDVAQEFASE